MTTIPQDRAPRTLAEELVATFRDDRAAASETSFELRSHGGYARTVRGKVAYLDEEARTFMVRVAGGGLIRVPLRDVASVHEASGDHEESRRGRDREGLGTTADPGSVP
jgi:hypothetical protein